MAGPDLESIFSHAPNPLIDPPNPFESYNKRLEEQNKNKPEAVSFEKLCYELFERTELGKIFMEWVMINKILPSVADKSSPFYQVHMIWGEGYKDFWRDIYNAIRSHKQRIQAGQIHQTEVKQ